MLHWITLFSPLLTIAALYWYPLRGARLEQDIEISAKLIYFAVGLLFLFWSVALLNCFWIHRKKIFQTRAFIVALFLAILCSSLVAMRVPGDFRVQTDEALLAATSERMYREQKSYTAYEILRFAGSEQVLTRNIDKRPPLFPFIVHFLHLLRGYSVQHSILTNLLLLPIFALLCFYLVPQAWGSGARICGLFAASLFLPVVIASRSGSADFLALVLLVASLLLTREYFNNRSRELFFLWICTLAIFAVSRMESVIAALLLLAAGFFAQKGREKFRTEVILILLPIVTICLWPVFQFLEPRWHFGEFEIRGSLLAVENFPRNFTALFLGFSNLVFGYPDLRGLGIMSCLTFLVLIATSIFRIREFYQINGSRIFFAWLCWGLASIVTYLIILWMPFGSFANPGALRLYAPLAIVLTLQLAFLYFKVSQLWVRAPQFLRAIRILCPLLFAFAIGRAFFTIDAERTFTDYGAFHQDRAVRKFLQEHLETSTLVVANESVQSLVLGVSAIDFLSARNNRELIFRAQSTGVIQKIFIVQSLDRNHMPLPNQDLTWEQTTLLKLPVSSRTVLRISQPRFD